MLSQPDYRPIDTHHRPSDLLHCKVRPVADQLLIRGSGRLRNRERRTKVRAEVISEGGNPSVPGRSLGLNGVTEETRGQRRSRFHVDTNLGAPRTEINLALEVIAGRRAANVKSLAINQSSGDLSPLPRRVSLRPPCIKWRSITGTGLTVTQKLRNLSNKINVPGRDGELIDFCPLWARPWAPPRPRSGAVNSNPVYLKTSPSIGRFTVFSVALHYRKFYGQVAMGCDKISCPGRPANTQFYDNVRCATVRINFLLFKVIP